MTDFIDVVFDGPPSHESGRFVEVEDPNGASIVVGEWIDRGDGLWALRIPRLTEVEIRRDQAEATTRELADLIKPFSGIGLANGASRSDIAAWLRAKAAALYPATETEGEQ